MEGIDWGAVGGWLLAGIAAAWALVAKVIAPAWVTWRTRDQEHRHEQDEAARRLDQLRALADAGSRTFTEEQLTQLTAETQVQLGLANEFIRESASARLDIIIHKLDQVAAEAASLPAIRAQLEKVVYELRNLQTASRIQTEVINDVNQHLARQAPPEEPDND